MSSTDLLLTFNGIHGPWPIGQLQQPAIYALQLAPTIICAKATYLPCRMQEGVDIGVLAHLQISLACSCAFSFALQGQHRQHEFGEQAVIHRWHGTHAQAQLQGLLQALPQGMHEGACQHPPIKQMV